MIVRNIVDPRVVTPTSDGNTDSVKGPTIYLNIAIRTGERIAQDCHDCAKHCRSARRHPDEGVVTYEFLSGVRGDVGSSEPTPSPTMKMCRLFVS
jgi:hypothetical protein